MSREKVIKFVLLFVIAFAIGFIVYLGYKYKTSGEEEVSSDLVVDLSKLTYLKGNKSDSLKVYKQTDLETFKEDYTTGKLPDVYITEFLYDGAGMYKPYDLDDFVSKGNDMTVEVEKITNINVNTSSVEFTGTLTGGMISVNTNDINSDINILLNNAKIDTNSKKYPAIYVYNKDINYSDYKVTIRPLEGTNNSVVGGKLKKVSLVPSDDLNIYLAKYRDYTNYYGVYNSEEVANVLFAKVEADREDLEDGDPIYYYKASGAISSDIDLYFEGKGSLEVNSLNKEGIETKGNLTFSGGQGDYVITAYDDCLNTTTSDSEDSNARNNLTIDVNSLTAIVSLEADEGDAIDSNGKLIINNGKIIAISKPGSDSGLDSDKGIYINGGTILATGDMYDSISDESKQKFILLAFKNKIDSDTLVVLTDTDNKTVFGYKTDRTYTNLVYSSSTLEEKDYYLYMAGDIKGKQSNGFYTTIDSYKNGTQLGYTSKGSMGGPNGGMTPPDGGMTKPENEGTTPPSGDTTPPEKPENGMEPSQNSMSNDEAYTTNKIFTIEGVSNLFSGVGVYGEL